MEWKQQYPMDHKPTEEEIADYVSTSLWKELCCFIETEYNVHPSIEYSRCSMAAGWNVKYKKSSRALCTLYPDKQAFTCMVSVGRQEAEAAEILLLSCTKYLQNLYSEAVPFNGGRWLMIEVNSPEILDDTKELIKLRVNRTK